MSEKNICDINHNNTFFVSKISFPIKKFTI